MRLRAVGLPVLAVPATADLVLLVIAVGATSTAAPLITATAAPALAIAFWRNVFGSAVVMPWALARRRRELRALPARCWWHSAAAGALLSAHFGTWISSLSLTSVASATALVSTQPVWAALLARARGHEVPAGVWIGAGLSVVGAAMVAGIDLRLSTRALEGDLLALVGAVMAAGYVTVGGSVRARVSTVSYTSICYATCALLLLVVDLATGQPLAGWGGGTWLKLVGLTLGAQLLGHSLFNVALRTASATMVSLVMLLEVPGATLLAALWLHQVPGPALLPGLALVLGGAVVVLRAVAGRERVTLAEVGDVP